MNPSFPELRIISTYTRQQALDDGELVDADSLESGMRQAAGFRYPIAFTRAAWLDTVHWDPAIEAGKAEPTGQDSKGRLWDVLMCARIAATGGAPSDRATVSVLRVPATGPDHRPDVALLRMVIGPGDTAEPVITIMLPDED